MSRQSPSTVSRRRAQIHRRKEWRKETVRIAAIVVALAALVLVALLVTRIISTITDEEDNVSDSPRWSLMTTARPLAELEPGARNGYYSSYPEMVISTDRDYQALIQTDKGDIRIKLFTAEAPQTVNNFVFLANQGFYDGLTFHRVIEDFMAQGGDPTGRGAGGPGYQFEDETGNGLAFDRGGLLAMANAGPNTNGSQFFITFAPTPWLNGNHTIFGEVVEGEEILSQLTRRQPGSAAPGDVIERIEIFEG